MLLNRPKDRHSPISTTVGIFWYDPKEELVLSFGDDLDLCRKSQGNAASALLHADLWKEAQKAVPELYADKDHLFLPRGRVNLVEGRFEVQCPPEFMADEQMRQQVMQDFGIHPLAVEFVGVTQ